MVTGKEIREAVLKNKDSMVDFLVEVVKTPSVTGDEAAIGKVIAGAMARMGIDYEVIEPEPGRPDIVGRWDGDPGPKFVFNGHMDVVPPGPVEDWIRDPWSGDVVDGCIHGRGSVDMKAGLCCSIFSVYILKKLGFKPKGSVVLTCVSDEQTGSRLGTQYLIEKGYLKGDFGLNCEPTNLRVEIAHKGILRSRVTVRGKAIHGSRPWLGIDAIEKTNKAITALYGLRENFEERKHRLLGDPTLFVGTIQGGACPNMIPSRCDFTIDRRIVPGETHDGAEREIFGALEDLRRKDKDFQYSYEITNRRPILDVPASSLIVKTLTSAWEELNGVPPVVGGKDAGTDASLVTSLTGIDMPVFGPGDYLKYSLGPNENVPIEDVLKAVEVYALTVSKLLS